MAHLLRGIAANGTIRAVAADTTDLVREAAARHNTSLTAGAALGRTLTGALLLSHVLLKNPADRVTLRLRGHGPLGGVIAEAGLDGTVRGYVNQPGVELPLREDGKLDVGGAVGASGDIEVIRSHAPDGDPYASNVALTSGEVAEDIAGFLALSEQIPSAVLLGVSYDPEGEVERAGGVLLQALPGAEEAALDLLDANVRAFGPLTAAMSRSPLPELLDTELCWGLGFEQLTEAGLPVSFRCSCSDAKALQALAYFTPEERERMIAEDGGADVTCHWCGQERWLGPEVIRGLSAAEVRCPDCGTLWYREGETVMVRGDAICACGRPVRVPAR